MKVEQGGHQSCQNPELLHLQGNPGWLKRSQTLRHLMMLSWSCDSHHSAAAPTCSPLPALWTLQTFSRPVVSLPLGLSPSVASCSQSPAADCLSSSADTVKASGTTWGVELKVSLEKASHPDLLQLCVLEVLEGVYEGAFDIHVQSISGLSDLVQSLPHTWKSTTCPTEQHVKHPIILLGTQFFAAYYQIPRLLRAPGRTATCSLPESPLPAGNPPTSPALGSWTSCWAGSVWFCPLPKHKDSQLLTPVFTCDWMFLQRNRSPLRKSTGTSVKTREED